MGGVGAGDGLRGEVGKGKDNKGEFLCASVCGGEGTYMLI